MPLTYTYSYALNQSHTATTYLESCQYGAWWLKAFLMGQLSYTDQTNTLIVGPPTGAWTCVASSDGVSTAGSDLWGGTFDASKLVIANGVGTNRSWIVLRSPLLKGSNWYLTLELFGPLSSIRSVMILFSKIAPAGGLVTARPTAADEWNAYTGTNTVEIAAQWELLHTKKFHGGLTSDGAFYVFVGANRTGFQYWNLMFWPIDNGLGGDQYPVASIMYYKCDASLSQQYSVGTLSELLLATVGSTSAVVRSRRFDGTSIFYGGLINIGLIYAYQAGQYTLPSKPGNSGYPTQQYADYAVTGLPRWPMLPIMVTGRYEGVSSRHATKGNLTDIMWSSATLQGGAVAPNTGTIEYATVGPLWIPANDWIVF